MKILLYTDLTITPDQLFWHRNLVVWASTADAFAQLFFPLIWKHFRGVFSQ